MEAPETYAAAAGSAAPLIGRERELAELEAGLSEARRGPGRLFLIAGDPGIGKTRLAEAAADRAEREGMHVLWGRAWESGGAPAYWPWVQLLRALIRTRDNAGLRAELGGGGRWLAQIVPELCDRFSDLRSPQAPGSEKARFLLFDAISSLLRNVAANEPLVVVLDDLHAADHASLLLLEFMAHGIGDAPILLLGLYQEPAARRRPEVAKLIGALGREGRTLVLPGLRKADVGLVAEHHAGRVWPAALVKSLHETTEGNPFFTSEVVRLLAAEGPPPEGRGQASLPLPDTVRGAIRRRFEPLGAHAIKALEAAAVIGREFRLATLERVTATEGEQLIELIDEAVSACLVAGVPGSVGRFRFTHNLIRDTLYSGLGTAERVRLHRAVGEALEQRYAGAPERLAELTHHFVEASPGGDPVKALGYAQRAGREAMRLFAYEQAAELYQLAIEMSELLEPDPVREAELLLALGRALRRADDLAAQEKLVAAAEAARGLDHPEPLAEAGLAMRAFPLGIGVLCDQPGGVLSEALERLEDRDSALRARVAARLAVSLYYWPGTEQRRAALVEEAVATARRLDDPAALAQVLANGQLATWGPDTIERDLVWMEEVLELNDQLCDDELELAARNRQIDLLVESGALPEADTMLRALELTGAESSEPRTPAYVALHRARRAIVDGRYVESERLNAEAAAEGSRLRDPTIVALAATQLVCLRWHQGRLDEVVTVIRRGARTEAPAAWPATLAFACCEGGHEDEARRELERLAVRDFADIPRYNGWLITMAMLAETCAQLGDARRAEKLYELLEPFAARHVTTPQAVYGGPVARFLAILAGARGDSERAAVHFARAREAAARVNARPGLMRLNLDEARMLARREEPGDRRRALELLAEAAPVAQELGLNKVVTRIGELERELGDKGGEAGPRAAAPPSLPARALLRREGDVWAFDFDERMVRVRHSKGVRCLALLLSSPGIEIHAVELARGDPGLGANAVAGARAARMELDGVASDDAGPLLDAKAKAAYRHRLDELREELEEAESFNDPERADRARQEMDFLTTELAGAVGLGGRDRRAASNAERARVSVTKAIRATIKRVAEHDSALGRELAATVRTGTFCVYEPDPRHPLEWHVDPG